MARACLPLPLWGSAGASPHSRGEQPQHRRQCHEVTVVPPTRPPSERVHVQSDSVTSSVPAASPFARGRRRLGCRA